MRIKKTLILLTVSALFLGACGSTNDVPSYVLTFYQPDGNHSDDYIVHIGQTTLDQIKTYADGLYDYTKPGYDRTWDWEHYDFAHQIEDWCITAIPVLHNYKITFMYNGEAIAQSSYTIKDTTFKVPEMKPKEKGFKYVFDPVDITGKREDIVVQLRLAALDYEIKFYQGLDDFNPIIVSYSYNNPIVNVPLGPEGYDSTWNNDDDTIILNAGEQVNLLEKYGEDKLDNFTLFLDKTPKTFTVTFNPNGGTMSGETSKTIRFDDVVTDLPVPTFKNGAKFLGWSDPESGKLLNNGMRFNVPRNTTLYARYGIDFESNESMNLIITGSRDTIASRELDSESKTEGINSLKMISKASTTFSCSFDADFITSAFADPSVVAINFDCKSQAPCTKFSYANSIDTPYEKDCCASDAQGFGAQQIWKTFSLTREMYQYQLSLDKGNCLICTVGGQLPIGNAFWLDNIHPVTEKLGYWGFENSAMVPYQKDSSWYNHTVSYRDFNNKEIFTVNYAGSITDDSPFGFDYDIKSEGNRSIKAHKMSNKNVWVYVMNSGDIASIQFDVYVTIELNTKVTFLKGNNTPMSDVNLKANTWTTYTVEVKDMGGSGSNYNFLYLTGSPEYDIYFDNFVITLK